MSTAKRNTTTTSTTTTTTTTPADESVTITGSLSRVIRDIAFYAICPAEETASKLERMDWETAQRGRINEHFADFIRDLESLEPWPFSQIKDVLIQQLQRAKSDCLKAISILSVPQRWGRHQDEWTENDRLAIRKLDVIVEKLAELEDEAMRLVTIFDHYGKSVTVNLGKCEKIGTAIRPCYFNDDPDRLCCPWLVKRFLAGIPLELWQTAKLTWLAIDRRDRSGVPLSNDQANDLLPEPATTTTSTTTTTTTTPDVWD